MNNRNEKSMRMAQDMKENKETLGSCKTKDIIDHLFDNDII